jgi:diguanylate cyclase (GGDEF)-like protein/PAS domain S-box-containing protein
LVHHLEKANPTALAPSLGDRPEIFGTDGGAMFKVFFDHGPEAIALTRASDSVIIEVNQEWLNLTGFSRQQAVGRTAVAMGHWADEAAREWAMRPLKTVGRVNDLDVTLTMQDGLPRLVRLNAVLVTVQSESYVLIYLRDVTAERLAQEALKASERALEQANEKLNQQVTLYEMTEAVAKVGHWVVYPDGNGVQLSHGYRQIGNLGSSELAPIGDHLRDVLDEDRAMVKRALKQMDGETLEYRWRRPDGVVIWIRSRMYRQVENGVLKADYGIVQDISREREALQAVANQLAATQQSEARFRALTELTSDWYWEQDANFRFVRVDGDIETARTMPAETFIGATRWDSGVQGVSPDQWVLHRAVLESHETFHDFEMQRARIDGSLMWVSISGAPIFDSQGVFNGYRGTGREISARKQAEADIERLAFFDVLTGLPNRRLLIDRLNQAIVSSARRGCYGALLFIDLDNFKMLNDTLGHQMGDALLKQVAQRLGECVRGIDTVARLGGDEFVVMLEELNETEAQAGTQAELVGKKILIALNQYFELDGQQHHSSPSIGVALFSDHHQTVDELLKRADLAMYQAKAAGRNTLRFFDPVMEAAASQRAALEADIRQGMARKEFMLYYQPVVDENSRITGVEALLRWQHPQRGLVSPAEFIPVAEQTGLILPLGQWVLEVACAQLVTWSAQRTTQRLTMAVNVSARQFRHPDFSDQILDILRLSGANPYRLKLELTESLLLSDIEDAIAKMSELRSIGVGFALDDFGTGYSSLSYLKALPLDQLKIDQSFVRDVLTDPNDAVIARTILNLAQSLDLSAVAEGVETAGQRDFLLRSGCKAFQGYLFGRPVPVDQLALPVA